MAPYEGIHDQLVERALKLARQLERLERLESEVDHPGQLRAASRERLAETRPFLEQLIDSARGELQQIKGSLHRIAAHEVGTCSSCAEPIPADRLEMNPHGTRCLRCAPALEPVTRMRSQHAGLRILLGSLDELICSLLESYRRDAADDGAQSAALALFSSLEFALENHFAMEEEGGYLSYVLAIAPRHSRKAETLCHQHAAFRKDVAKLAERARVAGCSASDWERIATDFREFSRVLLAHEQMENDLVADALLQDVGGDG